MTRDLVVGDIVERKYDGRLWVLVDIIPYPNDVHRLIFFDTAHAEKFSYTTPFGLCLPDAFLVR